MRGDVGVARGRDAIRDEAVNPWLNSWDDYREEIDEIRDLGDRVLLVVTQRGRGKGSGIEISNQWAFLVEVRDGLIARQVAYADTASALEAARP